MNSQGDRHAGDGSRIHFAASDPEKLIAAVRQAGVGRYLVVGGAASLTVPGTNQRLVDSGQIPPEWVPEISAGVRFLDRLKQEPEGLDWVFLSPSMLFGPGERTGKFRLGKDELLTAENGESSISYEDYAIALVDEIETPRHHASASPLATKNAPPSVFARVKGWTGRKAADAAPSVANAPAISATVWPARSHHDVVPGVQRRRNRFGFHRVSSSVARNWTGA